MKTLNNVWKSTELLAMVNDAVEVSCELLTHIYDGGRSAGCISSACGECNSTGKHAVAMSERF